VSCRVLIVEDDPDIRDSIATLLEDEGIAVATATNGAEALMLLRGDRLAPPSVILLDLMMPVMDGEQFRAEQVRDDRIAQIPVVVLSGHAYARSVAQSMNVDDVMIKPLSLTRLLSIVERYC